MRQILRLGPKQPEVMATLVSHAGGADLEFLNSGGPAHAIAWTIESARGTAGSLGSGEATSVRLYEPVAEDFRCVWTALDGRGRMHVWSYDGRHERLPRRRALTIADAFERFYA